MAGGLLFYYFSMDKIDSSAQAKALLSLSISAAIAGISVICATSNWWLHR